MNLLHSRPSDEGFRYETIWLVDQARGAPVLKGHWSVLLSITATSPPLITRWDIWQWLNANIAMELAWGSTKVFSMDESKMVQKDTFAR